MLLAIAVVKHHSIMGHELGSTKTETAADTSAVQISEDGGIVVNSTSIARDIKGYNGPIPMKIYVSNDHIDSIVCLANTETPEFFETACDGIINKYTGVSVEQAQKMQVDGVSGATYSSNAIKKTIRRSLAEIPSDIDVSSNAESDNSFTLKLFISIVVAICAAVVPLFYKKKTYRTIQLVMNVIILGLYAGTFVSYTSVTGILANGITLGNASLIILIITAFVYPVFGKKGYYCAWACPLGSAQELIGKTHKKKLSIPTRWVKYLNKFQKVLWACLMILALSGIFLEWMDYELFSAFLWQSASWIVILLAVGFLVLSFFINRPYCRFVCPTGVILKSI